MLNKNNTEVYDLLFANGSKVIDTNRVGVNALLLLAPNIKKEDKGLLHGIAYSCVSKYNDTVVFGMTTENDNRF